MLYGTTFIWTRKQKEKSIIFNHEMHSHLLPMFKLMPLESQIIAPRTARPRIISAKHDSCIHRICQMVGSITPMKSPGTSPRIFTLKNKWCILRCQTAHCRLPDTNQKASPELTRLDRAQHMRPVRYFLFQFVPGLFFRFYQQVGCALWNIPSDKFNEYHPVRRPIICDSSGSCDKNRM